MHRSIIDHSTEHCPVISPSPGSTKSFPPCSLSPASQSLKINVIWRRKYLKICADTKHVIASWWHLGRVQTGPRLSLYCWSKRQEKRWLNSVHFYLIADIHTCYGQCQNGGTCTVSTNRHFLTPSRHNQDFSKSNCQRKNNTQRSVCETCTSLTGSCFSIFTGVCVCRMGIMAMCASASRGLWVSTVRCSRVRVWARHVRTVVSVTPHTPPTSVSVWVDTQGHTARWGTHTHITSLSLSPSHTLCLGFSLSSYLFPLLSPSLFSRSSPLTPSLSFSSHSPLP